MKERLNVVLTGGNIGIGFQTVKGLASDGHYVIFGSRNTQRNQQALEKLRSLPNVQVDSFYLDLSNKKSIQQFSQNVKKALDNGPIDMLINNSGLLIDNKRISEMGIQMTMQINHFGHFYLTYLLFGNLRKSKSARIINVASYAHTFAKGPNTLENIRQDEGDYDMMTQYAKSKLANIQFTAGLAQRLKAHKINNIKTVSLHPGVVDSGFYQNTTKWYLRCFTCCCCCFLISSQTGARTSLYLARCPFEQLRNGEYCNDKQIYEPLRDNAKNEKCIQQLWSFSEKLYQIQFLVQ